MVSVAIDGSPLPPAPRRRQLLLPLVAVAGLLLAAAGTAVAVTRGGSTNSSAETESSASVTTEVDSITTIPSVTTGATTTTALSEQERFAAATASWSTIISGSRAATTSTQVGVVDGSPTAAILENETGAVSLWTADDDGTWSEVAGWQLEDWSPGFSVIENVRMVDLTDDDSAELFVEYAPGNTFVGRVYRRSAPGWTSVGFGERLSLQDDGTLLGSTKVCLPSCAEGFGVPYSFTWDGSQFVAQDIDDLGNPITVFIEAACPSYRAAEYAPLTRCDKGDAVRQLQLALDAAGSLFYSDYRQATDGYFGADTETSVRIYQLRNGLPVTGVADGQWYYDLIEAYNYEY